MFEISSDITIKKKASVYKQWHIGVEALSQIKTDYHCTCCNKKSSLSIIPYKTGFSLDNLLIKFYITQFNGQADKVISKYIKSSHTKCLDKERLAMLYYGESCSLCD